MGIEQFVLRRCLNQIDPSRFRAMDLIQRFKTLCDLQAHRSYSARSTNSALPQQRKLPERGLQVRRLTAFVGANGAGKIAVMLALLRLFGVTADHRRVRRQDFHVPFDEEEAPASRDLNIEAVLSFPELTDGDPTAGATVPEFFQQMAADENGKLKCRLCLEATWTDDGSFEGVIEEKHFAIRNLAAEYKKEECSDLRPTGLLDARHLGARDADLAADFINSVVHALLEQKENMVRLQM
jgi:predicted ATP-dependent endonuclease of OLD family